MRSITITIHLHQDVACQPLIDLIKRHLDYLLPYFNLQVDRLVLEWRTDTPNYSTTSHDYTNTDLLISLSQCAGLDPNLFLTILIVTRFGFPINMWLIIV